MRTETEIERAVLSSKIVLTLSVHEVNQILSIIGKFPFEEVQALVRNIQDLGQPQINATITKLKAEDEANSKVADVSVTATDTGAGAAVAS